VFLMHDYLCSVCLGLSYIFVVIASGFSFLFTQYVAFSALHCWLGGRKGIRPVKNGGMVEVGTA